MFCVSIVDHLLGASFPHHLHQRQQQPCELPGRPVACERTVVRSPLGLRRRLTPALVPPEAEPVLGGDLRDWLAGDWEGGEEFDASVNN